MSINMPDIIDFSRVYLAIFYTLVAAFYTSRIILMKRVHSNELIFPGERYCTTWWNHMVFRFFRVTIWGVCVLRLFFPDTDKYLGIFVSFQTQTVIVPGLLLLSFGFVATAAIHYRLGSQWRSGIDPNGPKRIVTSGLYKYSRNPMFVCVALAQFGFLLALPSYFSLVCLIVGLSTLYSQTKAEEKHLADVFPEEYNCYKQNVRRWV